MFIAKAGTMEPALPAERNVARLLIPSAPLERGSSVVVLFYKHYVPTGREIGLTNLARKTRSHGLFHSAA